MAAFGFIPRWSWTPLSRYARARVELLRKNVRRDAESVAIGAAYERPVTPWAADERFGTIT